MNQKKMILPLIAASLLIVLSACQSSDYCVVKGTIQGVHDGTRLELQDLWRHCKVVGTAVVKDGAFEFHPKVTAPAHVFLYQDDLQLQDFFLEPGTVTVDVNAEEGDRYKACAVGTPSNDARYKYRILIEDGREEAAKALMDSVFTSEETGPLALTWADTHRESAIQALGVLDRLSPDLAGMRYAAGLKEELSFLAKTEPRADYKPVYIDLEYSDAAGNPVSLSSVVNDPRNRYVLLDFWATWCQPCVNSLPMLKEIYEKYHGKGLEIYSVSLDAREGKWKSFLEDNDMDWIHVRDDIGGGRRSKLWETYAVNGIPMVLLIDGNTGEILLREGHPDLDTILSSLLEQ